MFRFEEPLYLYLLLLIPLLAGLHYATNYYAGSVCFVMATSNS